MEINELVWSCHGLPCHRQSNSLEPLYRANHFYLPIGNGHRLPWQASSHPITFYTANSYHSTNLVQYEGPGVSCFAAFFDHAYQVWFDLDLSKMAKNSGQHFLC